MYSRVVTSWVEFGREKLPVFSRRITPSVFVENLVIEYFDGAQQNGMCGARMLYKEVIHMLSNCESVLVVDLILGMISYRCGVYFGLLGGIIFQIFIL